MKIEKLNENKVRITLTLDELEKRQISLTDIEKDSKIAKDFFINLLEESNLDEEFELDGSHLFIEAASDNNNLFVITITKITDMPELKKYSLMENSNINSTNIDSFSKKTKIKKCKNNITKYKVDSNIYSFSNIDKILKICELSKNEKLFLGRNSLYKYEKTYFLIFNKTSVKNDRFLKTYVFLSEYCDNYYSADIYETTIKEKANLIIKDFALQRLNKVL